jgi:tRNA A37 threonylcarbamoyltransferase TsaD
VEAPDTESAIVWARKDMRFAKLCNTRDAAIGGVEDDVGRLAGQWERGVLDGLIRSGDEFALARR